MARGKRRARQEAEHERLLRRGTDDHYQDTELYGFEYADREDDLRWYRELAQRRAPQAILELGAGSGRITVPLARAGHRVIALDRMDAMLDALRRHLDEEEELRGTVEIVQADMRELPLDESSVDLVIAPFNALMHLYTWQDLLACFREVARVLAPGGAFAFDVELPDLEWLTWDPDERHAVTRFVHPRTGQKLIYSTNHRYDPETQICHIRLYYDDAPPPGRRFVPPPRPRKLVHLAHREVFPEEVRLLIHAAGLRLEEHTGDFNGGPLGPGVQSQVLLCSKPAE